MGYAFISYSTKNQMFADRIRGIFKDSDVDTWMAPYDIPVGSKYAATITRAIRDCSCFVLLLSNDSQASEAVDSEVELAALTFRKPIITVELENVELNDAFTFYIHNKQIIPIYNLEKDSYGVKQVIEVVGKHTKSADSELNKNTDKTLDNTVTPPLATPRMNTSEDIAEDTKDENEYFIFDDEYGNEIYYELYDRINYNGEDFAVFVPCDDESTGQTIVLSIVIEDGEEAFYEIEDEDTVNIVFAIFMEKFKDEFNFVDEEEEFYEEEDNSYEEVTPSASETTASDVECIRATMINCENCGAVNFSSASYCKVCSAKIEKPSAPQVYTPEIKSVPPAIDFDKIARNSEATNNTFYFCSNCGTRVLEGTRYCPCCHTAIKKSPSEPSVSPVAQTITEVPSKREEVQSCQNKICNNCGSSVRASVSYCPVCGTKLR